MTRGKALYIVLLTLLVSILPVARRLIIGWAVGVYTGSFLMGLAAYLVMIEYINRGRE